jgi:hypothetical protein
LTSNRESAQPSPLSSPAESRADRTARPLDRGRSRTGGATAAVRRDGVLDASACAATSGLPT